jgi:L-ascorbate metabolism protein UlaG (beta-lactamase superfamily)
MGRLYGAGPAMQPVRLFFLLCICSSVAFGQSESSIRYLANEGVMVTHDQTKILMDPLYGNSYDIYQLVPDQTREMIFSGAPPFDDVDAVFVSHHHGDHFSAEDMLRLLKSQTGTRLYAPAQAVAAIREIAGAEDDSVFDRVVGLDLDYGDPPVSIRTENIIVDAVHIPHSGWPTARTDVQNIAFRITLDDATTVLHLGDADARIVHFAADEQYWEERTVDLALPPYWFFGSDDGIELLENRLDVRNAIGIHVPAKFASPGNIPAEFIGYELFTTPGEGRRFSGSK